MCEVKQTKTINSLAFIAGIKKREYPDNSVKESQLSSYSFFSAQLHTMINFS